MKGRITWLSLALVLLSAFSAWGHQSSTAFLSLRREGSGFHLRWDIALRDLEVVVGLDENGDSEITWGELRKKLPEITTRARRAVSIEPKRGWEPAMIERRSAGAYLVLQWSGAMTESVRYDFLFDLDPSHQCVVELPDGSSAMLSRTHRVQSLGGGVGFASFVREGVTHIFAGIDHILFLIALLLPSVWKRTPEGWAPVGTLRGSLGPVLKIVTSFTIAHSLTLGLAAAGWVRLPSALVESVIAFSVVVAAANNLHPIWNERSWAVAFGFGLMHGFGFASVLGDLGLTMATRLAGILSFNLGVEIGQLAIVLIFLPTAFWLRDTRFYRTGMVRLGSAAIMLVAGVWFVERAFDVAIF